MPGHGHRSVVRFDETLSQPTRVGTWQELAVGTYQAIQDAIEAAAWGEAAELIRVCVEEARELREIFAVWPGEIAEWILAQGVDQTDLVTAADRLNDLLLAEYGQRYDIDPEWVAYLRATEDAAQACERRQAAELGRLVEVARSGWQRVHDFYVDMIYGLLDCVVRLCGEDRLGEVWDHLMRDWYDDHVRRLDVRNQPWAESTRQLMTAIVHGFHGHLSGADRRGGTTYLEESDRVGFRFEPCGSGGRAIRDDTTDGRPRPEAPFALAVTTRPHDWSWKTTGVQAYCVHCCLLNMVVPIDRLGYPTRVVEPPTWPGARDGGACTWWIYKDPALVPDDVYARVGRTRPGADAVAESTGQGGS